MFALFRAGLVAALAVLACPATASGKAFERSDLADSLIRLEAQIRNDAGPVTRPAAQLRREAEAAFQKGDFRAGLQLLGQAVAAAPEDAGQWLRLARAVSQIRPADDRERILLLERAATAAYAAYRLTRDRGEEADALVILGRSYAERRIWRPALNALRLALELREAADIRIQYERMRDEHGFRLLDYKVESDSASPRVCFQFSENLAGRRADYSPFVSVEGQDRPAVSGDDRQLCVEGLKHGERYAVSVRAGLPSAVSEVLARTVDFSVYVRDRQPLVRFAGKAYVLPRQGQRGMPVVSVNTAAVEIEIFRVGDRNLLNTVLGNDFQRALYPYELERLAGESGIRVWGGELSVERTLNAEVTTAFPVGEAVGELAPGVYAMIARPAGRIQADGHEAVATQWFIVSDLGLSAYSGNDGVHAFVHSLATADPKGQVEVRLLSRSNEVLAARRTDGAGRVSFEANLTRGEGGAAPALLVASEPKGDYAFLNLKAPAFDLGDRGVAGRVVPAGLDAFVYAERGVYRTGETVHLTALLRDALGAASPGVPLTLVATRPDGVEYRRAVLQDQGLGGRSLALPIADSAMSGTWRVQAFADPKRAAIGETTFMVEDYVPDRLEFELSTQAAAIARDAPTAFSVEGRFLYGAPASGIVLEGEAVISPVRERPGFAGYLFGAADDEATPTRQALEDLARTDERGRATFPLAIDRFPETARPLQAQIAVRMADDGGRAVERKTTLPVAAAADMIGIKPLFARRVGDNDQAAFEIVFVQPDGRAVARTGLRYELLRVQTRYQWYRQHGQWDYEPVRSTTRVADGQIDVPADGPARLSLPVTWGRYRLEVSTGESDGPLTAVNFDSGFYAEAAADTPDLLELALDRTEYAAGDTINIAVTARSEGRLTIDVVGDRLISSTSSTVQPGVNSLRIGVGRDWGNGAYIVATLRRPLDAKAQRMPGRAIGVQWFSIDRKVRTLALDMALPPLVRPNSSLRVPVKLGGLAAGEEARIVVAAVDVGILNLTGYRPPAPDDHYLGQRRLTAEIRDLYGQLIDGMQGTRGQIRSGGDGGAALEGSPPAQAPLALYSGIVPVRPDGTAEIGFDLPAFAGTVRVMAIAWSRDKLGRASGDVVVRDPVVVSTTLPRFMRNGDASTMHLDIDNVEGAAGDYAVAVTATGAVGVGERMTQTLRLRAKQRDSLAVPLTGTGAGTGTLTVRVTGPSGFALERSYALAVKPAAQVLARRTVHPLARGETLVLTADLFADLVPGTGTVSLSIGPSTALDAAALLKALDRYPFGCTEQIASRALPLLYVNELAQATQLALDAGADERVRQSIERILARQGADGSFGLWGIGGEDPWLDAYVTDFLTRARERGFVVPDAAFRLAVERLRNFIGTAQPGKDGGRNLAYALYVLARNNAAPLGELRYVADTGLNDLETPIARAQVAAALGLLGDRVRAERAYAAALQAIAPQPALQGGRSDFGSVLRDAAAYVTLASEGGAPRSGVSAALQRIEAARGLSAFTSTQENAWLVLAARAIARDSGDIALSVGGAKRSGPLYRSDNAAALQAAPLRVTNEGEQTLQAVITVSGAPVEPEPEIERGFRIERQYFTLDGRAADIANAKQNQRFVAVLKVTELQPQFGRIVVADHLPAGLEIDNPRLVSSGDTGALGWIEDAAAPVHAEFRDDRFTAAFERESKDSPVFAIAYVVRAVSPGRYVLPQAYVEDMYRPDRYGRTGTGAMTVTAGP